MRDIEKKRKYEREYRRKTRGRNGKINWAKDNYPDWYPDFYRKQGYDKEYRDFRMAKIDELKGTTCSVCGGEYPPVCLDFHHRNPSEKEAGMGRLALRKPEDILAEIAKCDVVCSNCHRKIHWLTEDHRRCYTSLEGKERRENREENK